MDTKKKQQNKMAYGSQNEKKSESCIFSPTPVFCVITNANIS